MSETFNVIAATPWAALAVAELVSRKSLPDLYPTPADALAAWRGYPLPLHSRYHPWAVSLQTGKSDDLTKRLSED